MKLTNLAIINILNCFSKFPLATGKAGYAIARNKRLLSNELKDFEEARNALLQKYGTKTKDGNYTIDPNKSENAEIFNKEISEVLGIEIDIEPWQVFRDEWEIPYSDSASVNDYDLLETFLVKERPVEEAPKQKTKARKN